MSSLVIEAESIPGAQRQVRVFQRSPVFVGRGEDADLRLDADSLSPIHGRIAWGPTGIEYVSLTPCDGTFVAGRLIVEDVPIRVAEGEVILLAGVAQLRVRQDPPVERSPSSVQGIPRPRPIVQTEQRPLPELLERIAAFEAAEQHSRVRGPAAPTGTPAPVVPACDPVATRPLVFAAAESLLAPTPEPQASAVAESAVSSFPASAAVERASAPAPDTPLAADYPGPELRERSGVPAGGGPAGAPVRGSHVAAGAALAVVEPAPGEEVAPVIPPTVAFPNAALRPGAPDLFSPGDMIAQKFRVESKLGGGGQAQVFKVVNVQNNRPFAVKALNPALVADPEARSRFEAEAKTAGSIDNENVVAVIDSGTERGIPFILMEYLRGETLAEVLRHGTLELDQAVEVTLGILAGLEAAHAKGIVHRDIKPENIFIVRTIKGLLRVKILDFGIAKLLDDGGGPTLTRRLLGTCHYVSPEQAEGDKPVDARSDQYSVAVVLYRMLTGKLPHEGLSFYKVLNSIVEGRLIAVRRYRPDLPPEFEAALGVAMSTSPESRYRDVHAFGAALLRFASPEGQTEYAMFARAPINPAMLSTYGVPVLRLSVRPEGTTRPPDPSLKRDPLPIAGGTRRLPSEDGAADQLPKAAARSAPAAPAKSIQRSLHRNAPQPAQARAVPVWLAASSVAIVLVAVGAIGVRALRGSTEAPGPAMAAPAATAPTRVVAVPTAAPMLAPPTAVAQPAMGQPPAPAAPSIEVSPRPQASPVAPKAAEATVAHVPQPGAGPAGTADTPDEKRARKRRKYIIGASGTRIPRLR